VARRLIPEATSRSRLLEFIKKHRAKAGITEAAGSNTQIQFNDAGVFGADADLVWDTTDGDGLGIGLQHYGNKFPQVHLDVNYGYLDDLDNDTGGGESVAFGTGTTTAGKLYYLKNDGVWTEARANAVATGAKELLGIALGTDPATNGMLLRGFFQMTSYLQGTWDEGIPVYVSDTHAGQGDIDIPASSGDFVRVIGYCGAGTTDLIYFNPSSTYIELS